MHTQKAIVIFLGFLVVIVLGGVLHLARSIVLPFMIALFLSYLLEPIVRFMTRLRIPLALAVFCTLLLAFVLLGLVGTLFYTSVQTFVDDYPRYEPKLRALLMTLTSRLSVLSLDWETSDLRQYLTTASVARAILSSLGSFVTFFGHLMLSLLFTIFILIGHQRLPGRIHRAFGETQAQHITQVLQRVTGQVQIYLVTKALVSLVTGLLVNLSLLLIGVEFAQLWGALALMLNFIPNLGSVVAACPAILVAILQFNSLLPAVWVTIAYLVINVGFMLLEPRIMGERLNLSPLLVVMSLVFWGWLWGIMGMVLAVPMMVTIKIICENIPSMHKVSVLMSGR